MKRQKHEDENDRHISHWQSTEKYGETNSFQPKMDQDLQSLREIHITVSLLNMEFHPHKIERP